MASDYLYISRDRSKLRSTTQLTLQSKNPLVLVAAGDLPWQVIRNDAYPPLGSHCERRPFRHDLQAVQRKYPHPTTNERFSSPTPRKLSFRRPHIPSFTSHL